MGAVGALARRIEHDGVGRSACGRADQAAAGTFRRPRSTAAGSPSEASTRPRRDRDQMAREVAAAGVQLQHDSRRSGPTASMHGGDERGVGGAADLREAARRDRQRRAARLGDVDVRAPERRLAGERQADDARGVQAIDLAAGVRRARGVGARRR